MIDLYNTPHSTCSQKVRICLAEKGLSWTDRHVNLATNEHLSPDYLTLNPNGVVPTLVHDGDVIIDSSVICEYLDEIYPDPPLTPTGPFARAKMRSWMRYIEEVPTPAVRVPSFNLAFLPRFDGLSEEQFFERQSDIRPLRKHFYRRMGPSGFDDEDFQAALEQIGKTAERMAGALDQSPWLAGGDYSLADVIMAPLIDRMNDMGFSGLWEDAFPAVSDWYSRVQQRPAFQAAFSPGTRLSELHQLSAKGKSTLSQGGP
jgi:glutathione S-transferase